MNSLSRRILMVICSALVMIVHAQVSKETAASIDEILLRAKQVREYVEFQTIENDFNDFVKAKRDECDSIVVSVNIEGQEEESQVKKELNLEEKQLCLSKFYKWREELIDIKYTFLMQELESGYVKQKSEIKELWESHKRKLRKEATQMNKTKK